MSSEFHYSKHGLSPQEHFWQRVWEIIPGAISWSILISLTLASIIWPFAAAIVIIAFYLYWLLRLLYMTLFLVLSYLRLDIEKKTDWIARIHGMDEWHNYLPRLTYRHALLNIRQRFSLWTHKQEIADLTASGNLPPLSTDIHHLVIFPIVKEEYGVIEEAVKAISTQPFALKQITVVLAVEERAKADIQKGARLVEQKYKNIFHDCLVIIHPDNLPGEARVKGANITFAAKKAEEFYKAQHIPLEHIIVSCFDADTIVSASYFPCLTYHFMVCPNRLRASFQPIPVYHNNIWNVPGFARVIETGSSFFQMVEATNPEKLVTFSSHSMSFKALVDVGYWPIDMISDDSAIFWKCYLKFAGDYRVIPMYVTVSMDVVAADHWWQTTQSVYKQKRRWAWGVENVPLVMRGFAANDQIKPYEKIRHGFKLLEGHISWASWGFILSFIGWLPVLFARKEFAASVVYYNVGDIANTIFNLAFLCLAISILLSLALLPKTKIRHSWLKKIIFALEWMLVPVILLFLSALPALDAQTRLMRGKYLEFWVADKRRVNGTQK